MLNSAIRTLVLAPDVPFERIDTIVRQLGWTRRADPHAPEPIIPGEPETVVWSRTDSDVRLTYTFHPAMALRVVTASKPASAWLDEIRGRLPTLDMDAIAALLRSDRIESVLLGLYAARELQAIPLLEPVCRLAEHGDPTIAREAVDVSEQLVRDAISLGAEWITEEREKHPDRSVLFMHAGNAQDRRQVLRWMITEYGDSRTARSSAQDDSIEEVLRTALEDPDWEVRMTAMLAAGRLGAARLRSSVQRLEIPDVGREGLDRIDVHALTGAREVVVAHLNGDLTSDRWDDALATLPGIPPSFARSVLGMPIERHDRTTLLIHALTTPVPNDLDLPDELPAGVDCHPDNSMVYTLGDSGIRLIWIPPVPHWLGHAKGQLLCPNPIREVRSQGYFISEQLIGTPHVRTELVSLQDAEQACSELSARTGAAVVLPSADEWEMAARGPDGRRYPWGNGVPRIVRDAVMSVSPWGVRQVVASPEQWTRTMSSGGHVIVCGGRPEANCAVRREATASEVAAVRVLVHRSR